MDSYYISENETIIGPLTIDELAKAKVSLKSKFCTVGATEWHNISEFPDSSILRKLFPPPSLPEQIKITPIKIPETIDTCSFSEGDKTHIFLLEKRSNKEILRNVMLVALIAYILLFILCYIILSFGDEKDKFILCLSGSLTLIFMVYLSIAVKDRQIRTLKIDEKLRLITVDYTKFIYIRRTQTYVFENLLITIKSKLIPNTLDKAEPNKILFYNKQREEIFRLQKHSASYPIETFNHLVLRIDTLTSYKDKKDKIFNKAIM